METHSHSIRVLAHPPPVPGSGANLPPQSPPPPPAADTNSFPRNGVVVVGFIGRRHHDVAHLINKVIDSHVFGSGNLASSFRLEPDKIDLEMGKWFDSRRLSFYHDEDRGILYLQLSSLRCPTIGDGSLETRVALEPVFEEQELGELQGLIFMFSVSHILILIQEGSRFDTQMLKKFRILQAAKHTMAPFLNLQNLPSTVSKPRSSVHPRIPLPNNPSPGKTRGILNRNVTVMSGLGSSNTSFLPGQCTPVVLFVFLDEFTEAYPSGNLDGPPEASLTGLSKPGPPLKGPSPVVVLARPTNKSEGGLRKKLQSSLEAQIRFSIKKCRTLESGTRGGPPFTGSSSPLFSLDSSKAVLLVDARSCMSGESLEFAIGLVEQVLDGKATPDSLLLGTHGENMKNEGILSVKDFIYRQADLLRGKGGSAVGSSGVGLFVAAAAAAAVSATSKKMPAVPELPTFETWLSSSRLILHGILSAKCISQADESGQFESAVSPLRSCVRLNMKYSMTWCEKSFPVAKGIYLDNLPSCYPSFLHEEHLTRALQAFSSLAKGPAVRMYMEKLKDECTSIWVTGRQLCDAVSLTGKPCVHQKHDKETLSVDEIKSHSSGFVYLHACGCGRTRRIRPDPFNFETANSVFDAFADCDKLLPSVELMPGSVNGPIRASSWKLIHVGSTKYYDPSKGLMQSGFCSTQKFLLRWALFLEKRKEEGNNSGKVSLDKRTVRVETNVDADRQTRNEIGAKTNLSLNNFVSGGNSSNAGRGLTNFTMKKPFSEVVAGTGSASSAFPPLLARRQPVQDTTEKGVRLHHGQHRVLDKSGQSDVSPDSQMVGNIDSVDRDLDNGNQFPHISSTLVPSSMNSKEQVKASDVMKHVMVYVGFEHECPHGHRFILTENHLSELGPACSDAEESVVPLPVENSDKKQDQAKLGRSGGHGRNRRRSNGIITSVGGEKTKNLEKSREKVPNGNMSFNKSMKPTRQSKDQNERTKFTDLLRDLDSDNKPTNVDGGGCAFKLINRNLPVYMECPHCRDSATKNDMSNLKFASNISQLQRIFVVTPSFPVLLAANPIVQFELSCLPPTIPDRERKLQFSLGCPVILPPDSFLSLRLPFVYGIELEDGSVHSLTPFENQPQMTACIVKGTALRVVSNRSNLDPASVT
ncbi:protein SMG8 [Striga asiatica]|uniref:Nonsense-mediated mRNA decay factor SMG8 n=1 Tax=Striga asiatica TaxID=4170 RepID=A0A5A7Q6N0_STRAF|nr:protein SMG8 [Striga asiatica]